MTNEENTRDNPRFRAAVDALTYLSEHDMFSAMLEAIEICKDAQKQIAHAEDMDRLAEIGNDVYWLDEELPQAS